MSIKCAWPVSGAILLVGNFGSFMPGLRTPLEQMAFDHAKNILTEGSPRSAMLFDSGTHSDFRTIMPEENSQWIKVDQIRELIQWAMAAPQISNKKVAILAPAHAMNLQAANAFLKTLEEVSLSTLFILITDRVSLIPVTVRSRCFWVRIRTAFNKFNEDAELKSIIQRDLQLLAKKQCDPVSIASEWLKNSPKETLHWLLVVLSELINKAALEDKINVMDQPWEFIEAVLEAKRALEEPNPPNIQLLMESLLIRYAR
jgi:hypothetical protein